VRYSECGRIYKLTAIQSNSGAACTCVVTEFHYHDCDNFVIEKELFTMDEIMGQVTELLQSYRCYYLNSMDMDQDDKKSLEERVKIARDTFQAMFRGRLESEQFFIDGQENSVLETLRSWVQEMRPSTIHGREVTLTPEDCSTLLAQLTSEPCSDQQPAAWPYLRKIK
jgi:hypothetical protein